jgi:hypothetical protein
MTFMVVIELFDIYETKASAFNTSDFSSLLRSLLWMLETEAGSDSSERQL